MDRRFHDRCEAGRLLAQALMHYAGRQDVVVLALPCLVLFLLLQRHYIRGFMSGALKG